jgi:hypothetical protein
VITVVVSPPERVETRESLSDKRVHGKLIDSRRISAIVLSDDGIASRMVGEEGGEVKDWAMNDDKGLEGGGVERRREGKGREGRGGESWRCSERRREGKGRRHDRRSIDREGVMGAHWEKEGEGEVCSDEEMRLINVGNDWDKRRTRAAGEGRTRKSEGRAAERNKSERKFD